MVASGKRYAPHCEASVTNLHIEDVSWRAMTAPRPAPTAAARRLEIRVLGPMEAIVDGRPLQVDTRKALAILAMLAVEARPFAREELAAMLWPEADDESARGALRRTLSVLRTGLGGVWLEVDRSMASLEPGAWVDLHLLDAAGRSRAADRLAEAAALARGPFLAGFSLRDSPAFDDWRATWETAVERMASGVLDRLAEALDVAGDLAGAVSAAARRVDLNPLDEPAQRRLMLLIARTGDRAGAILRYRACVAALDRELGVAPLAETTELYEAIRDDRIELALPPAPVPEVGEAGLGRLPMVGRQEALAAVVAAHRGAAPDGRVVLVSGEAGIGKTRLVEAALADARLAPAPRLAARCFEAERDIAYGTVIDLLRAGLAREDGARRVAALPSGVRAELGRLLPLLSPDEPAAERSTAGVEGPAARARLLDAIAAGLVAMATPPAPGPSPAPGVVVVEDLQWADGASRAAIAWLARRLAGKPVLLLLTWRPEDLDEDAGRFAAALEALDGATVIRLARLDRPDVARLVASAAMTGTPTPSADALFEASEGLPLFVVEALAAGSPESGSSGNGMRALLRQRLAAVSDPAGQILSAAAVLGRTFDLPVLRQTSGRTEEEAIASLEELLRRGLIREQAGGPGVAFDFSHARLRDAAYEATSLARRRLLHRRAAKAMRSEPSMRDDPGQLAVVAGHLRDGGLDSEAAALFVEAGRQAQALHALTEAAAHLETALALGYPDVAEVELALGEIRTRQGDYAAAVTALEAAAARAEPAMLPSVELRLGQVHARRGELERAAGHLEAAITGLEGRTDAGARALLVRAVVERAVVARRAGDLGLAAALGAEALDIAEAAGDGPGSGAALRLLGLVAHDRADLAAARDVLERSLALAGSDPDPGSAIAARNALALVEAADGRHAAAIDLLEAALADIRRIGARHLEAAVENNLADQLHALGRSDDAMDHLRRAVALFAEVGGRPGELEPEIWKLVDW